MQASPPFFSICVPTRNRSEYLFYCLKSLLHQDFDAYEIIVSDNCDEEESRKTADMIKELDSPRLKYFKPDTILSMTGNYEFALSKAQGQYILCIGDDDGIVADSLQYVFDFIQKYKARVVKCPRVEYGWPGSFWNPDSIMTFPLTRPVVQVDSRSILEKVAKFEMRYSNLPMLYYGFVDRTIIDEVVREKGSFWQNSASVDMYSGFVIAHKVPNFYLADKPFVILGSSNKSTGALGLTSESHETFKEYLTKHNLIEAYQKFKIPVFPKLVLAPFVWLEMMKFLDNYSLQETYLAVDHRNFLISMISSEPIFDEKDNLGLGEDFKQYPEYDPDIAYLKENFLGTKVFFPLFTNENTEFCQHAVLDPRLFGIKNIYEVALLSRDILKSKVTLSPIKLSNTLLDEYKKRSILPKSTLKSLAKRAIKRLFR
jgi:glycosyltransferase involved in cell wall biosynthesis